MSVFEPIKALTGTPGLVAIFLLLALLITKEFIRMLDRPWKRAWMRRMDFAIVPLLFVFGLVIIVRFLTI